MSRIFPFLILPIFLCANIARADESQGNKKRLMVAVDESVREGFAQMYERLFK
jgi:hypothetical protein